MSKKKRGKSIDDLLVHRLRFLDVEAIPPNPEFEPGEQNFVRMLDVHNPDYLNDLFDNLRKQVRTWMENEPENPLAKDVVSDGGSRISALSDLLGTINRAEKYYEDENLYLFGVEMYLMGEMVGRLNHVEGWRSNLNSQIALAGGRPAGRKAASANAKKRKELIKKAAIDYFRSNPTHSNSQAISNLKQSLSPKVADAMSRYKNGTLEKILAGTRDEALTILASKDR